jgi:predicted dehydrogenase
MTMGMESMRTVRWGIIGCGDVTEVKSGPGFQKADGSALVAVMRRDGSKARDYARRHGVARAYDSARGLIDDPDVDAVYVATPPSSHAELALVIASAGKPCLVEKPMAITYAECTRMADAFESRGVPLWVAYYRRALPRFLKVRDLLRTGIIGQVTSVHVQVSASCSTWGRTAWICSIS